MQVEPLFLMRGHAGPAHPYPKVLEAEVLEVIAGDLSSEYQGLARQKIGGLECPIHHRRASVTIIHAAYVGSSESFAADTEVWVA